MFNRILVRIRNNRAIVLGNYISDTGNKRFVLNLPQRLQDASNSPTLGEYATEIADYLRKFFGTTGPVHVEVNGELGQR